ncbi:MAG TPA: MATE family efflux transporter [bacterium]|nr:MATE family efflux transporter [bacterium]
MSTPSDHNDRAILEVVTPRSGTVGEVLTLAAPLVVSFVSFSLMGVVDTLVMGRVGTPEQGAVGLGAMLTWGLAVVFTATLTAVNTFVAQDYGAGNHHRISGHVRTAAFLIPLFTVLVWALIPLLPAMIRILGSDPAVAPHILAYMNVRIMGVPFLFVNFTLTSFLRGLGDMRTPMVVTIVANIVNAALTIWFVFGGWFVPAMGVPGAALGSLIGGICEALLYLAIYFDERRHRLYRTRTLGLPTLREIGRFLKVGMPIGFAWAFDMFAWMLFSIYASTLQPAALAAHMIIFQIIHFSFLPAAAVGVVGTTLVGQYLGAQRVDLAKRSAWWTIRIGVGYMTLMGLTMALTREHLIAAFNADPAVVFIGGRLLLLAAIFQPFDGIGMTITGALRGAGDTRAPMLIMLGCATLVFMPGVYLLGIHLKYEIFGAWTAAVIYVITLGILLLTRFLRGHWTRMKV